MTPQAFQKFLKVVAEIRKGKAKNLPDDQLDSHEQYFSTIRREIASGEEARDCQDCLDTIRQEKERRRIEERHETQRQESKLQHQESQDIGKKGLSIGEKGLRRADLAIVLSVVAILISVAGPIYKIFFPKSQRASTETASLPTYRQTPMPTAASQEQAANSNSPTPSTKESPTAQPLVSPPES